MVSKQLKNPAVSIVIPLYNEEEGVADLTHALQKLASKLHSLEIVFVDDGSKDQTFQLLKQTSLPGTNTQLIRLSRNFGHQAALLAGLTSATGDVVVTMDADLQHPPELILEMVKHHQRGIDIVYTQRQDTEVVPMAKRVTSTVFYWLLNFLTDTPITSNASDFRSMNRKTVTALLSLPEKRLFLRGMVQWLGYSSVTLPFVVGSRRAGTSKYSLLKMFKLALFGVTSFSSSLLYASALLSLILFILATLYGAYVVYIALVLKIGVSGWASMLLVVLTLGALLSLSMSIIGLYLAAMYEEIKHRPHYLIAEKTRVSNPKT